MKDKIEKILISLFLIFMISSVVTLKYSKPDYGFLVYFLGLLFFVIAIFI